MSELYKHPLSPECGVFYGQSLIYKLKIIFLNKQARQLFNYDVVSQYTKNKILRFFYVKTPF